MFIIKTKQLDAIGGYRMHGFLERMILFIKENFENEINPDDTLRKEVEYAVNEAKKYGFEYETDIEDYLFLKWSHPEMRQQPLPQKILDILNFPDRPAHRKISILDSFFE